eukprot:jgi/Ulvmu1/6393/UM003_0021.1
MVQRHHPENKKGRHHCERHCHSSHHCKGVTSGAPATGISFHLFLLFAYACTSHRHCARLCSVILATKCFGSVILVTTTAWITSALHLLGMRCLATMLDTRAWLPCLLFQHRGAIIRSQLRTNTSTDVCTAPTVCSTQFHVAANAGAGPLCLRSCRKLAEQGHATVQASLPPMRVCMLNSVLDGVALVPGSLRHNTQPNTWQNTQHTTQHIAQHTTQHMAQHTTQHMAPSWGHISRHTLGAPEARMPWESPATWGRPHDGCKKLIADALVLKPPPVVCGDIKLRRQNISTQFLTTKVVGMPEQAGRWRSIIKSVQYSINLYIVAKTVIIQGSALCTSAVSQRPL